MADKSTGRNRATKTETEAIYYDVSPNIILLLRMFNFLVLVMAIISFVICLVQGGDQHTFYLLACNTVISCFVGIVINWWYRSGDLGPEKYWYIFLVGAVLVFQFVTTDIFVFNTAPPTPTPSVFTTRHHNFTTRTTRGWITLQNATTVRRLEEWVTLRP